MKYGVSSNTLLLTAGIVWLVAGINILRIGISCWITDAHYWLLKVCEASLIFLLFFCMIFHKLYRKHAQRITAGNPKTHPKNTHRIPQPVTPTNAVHSRFLT